MLGFAFLGIGEALYC